MTKADDLALVASTLRRARAIQAALALASLVATFGFLFLWQAGRLGTGPAGSVFALSLCAATGVLAARFIALFRARLPIETSAAYQALENAPDRILWMLPKAVDLRIAGFRLEVERDILLLTDDGKALRIHGVTKANTPRMEAALRRLAPHADFGLSEKNRRRYQHATGLIVR